MPLLLQGLSALARHVDRMGHSASRQENTARFNPRIWLAQYILRNHPGHQTGATGEMEDLPNYASFTERASIERGRRELRRRRSQVEAIWGSMERRTQGQTLNVNHMPLFGETLDESWNLQGTLRSKLPKHYMEALGKTSGTER